MRINHVKKSRKAQGNCVVCGEPIDAGSAYKYVQEYRGPKRSAHEDCSFRSSHTTSGRLAEVYAAQESAQDELHDMVKATKTGVVSIENLTAVLENLRDEVQRLGEEYQEAADAIGEHFDGSEQHQELEDAASELEDWASNIDDLISELGDGPEDDDDETAEQRLQRRVEWVEEMNERTEIITTECPL